MHENFVENSDNELTSTKRKNSKINFFQKQHNSQINPRIFKYPYLVQRSSQKFKQDNESNKSTEKWHRRTQHRRRIFQETPKSSNVRLSTLSVDRINKNRNQNGNYFQNNPIGSKLHNKSKNKSNSIYSKENQQNSFTKPLLRPTSVQGPTPVVFHYTSPYQNNPAYYLPKPNSVHQSTFIPGPHVQILSSYPQPQPISYTIRPTLSMPLNSSFAPSNLQVSTPYQSRISPQFSINNPIYTRIETFNKSPQIKNNITQSPILNNNQKIRQTLSFSPFPLSKTSQQISTFPEPITVTSSTNPKSQALQFRKANKQQQNKKAYRQSSNKKLQKIPSKKIIQTNKIVYNKIPSSKQHYQRNQEKRKYYNRQSVQPKSASSLHKRSSKQQSDIGIHNDAVEDDPYDQQDNNSDRFFDMDFKNNKKQVHQSQKYWTTSINNNRFPISIDLQKNNAQNNNAQQQINNEQKKFKVEKKSTITSIKLGEKNNKAEENIQSNKQILQPSSPNLDKKSIHFLSKVEGQGRFLILFLIGLGVLLVVFQILK